MSYSVFIFRRDLRLSDNTGLIAAMAVSSSVKPLFIVDPAIANKWSNSTGRMAFLVQSLKCLDRDIAAQGGRLHVIEGRPEDVISRMLADKRITSVFTNRDYTPIAQRRDKRLKEICQSNKVDFYSYADQLLNEPESVSKSDGSPYTVFTPYYNKAQENLIQRPNQNNGFNFSESSDDGTLESSSLAKYLNYPLYGLEAGTIGARKALEQIEQLTNYDESKDIPAQVGTSRLSAHLRFGTCSVRECYHSIVNAHSKFHGLSRQLFWRDFYFQIAYFFPHVFSSCFREKYNALTWNDNADAFECWTEGKTGFPIVDAGMRELRETGFMHNRVRMVVASFLTKNLLINWRHGEAHFAKHLLDFDPALNNGNWQWCASTGCDAQPFFRVFNPWRQQLKFDKECRYIKRWIPELRGLEPRQIHQLEKTGEGYLPIIINLKDTAAESKLRFREIRG